MEREFTAVIEKRGRWYVAYVEEIPGVNTQGRTLAEARRNLQEAIRLIRTTAIPCSCHSDPAPAGEESQR